jgi:hypothetical protein
MERKNCGPFPVFTNFRKNHCNSRGNGGTLQQGHIAAAPFISQAFRRGQTLYLLRPLFFLQLSRFNVW